MAGSFDLSGSGPVLASQAAVIYTCLYDASAESADEAYTVLPNVYCERIRYSEGVEPPTAKFSYLTADELLATFGWPSQAEQIFPITAQGDYVVQSDDELAVITQNPDGSPFVLWHGFAQIPQLDISGTQQSLSFVGVGVAARKFDKPISGRVQRNSHQVMTTDGSADIQVDLPARFNPADNSVGSEGGYVGNAVGFTFWTDGDSDEGNYPVFADPLLRYQNTDSETMVELWYVSDIVKYLIATEQLADGETVDDQYIDWPDFATLDALLQASYPTGSGPYKPGGTDTQTADITVRDYDAANRPMPEVIGEVLGYCGFLCTWQTATDGDGLPTDYLRFYRRDGASTSAAKTLYLNTAGNALDPSLNNATQIHLSRDANQIVNATEVETALREVEISVLLAPLFEPSIGDEESPLRDQFKNANLTNATAELRRAYRWYGADECGVDGHWNALSGEWVTGKPLDLSSVFPPEDDGTPSYVTRYRPGQRTVIAKDSEGKPKKAVLEIYFGYYSIDPYLETDPDPTGWQTVTAGWKLLDDRLGIEVTIDDPEQWNAGNPKVGKIAGITWVANPGTSGKQLRSV